MMYLSTSVYVGNAEKLTILIAKYSKKTYFFNAKMEVVFFSNDFLFRGVLAINHIKAFRILTLLSYAILPWQVSELFPLKLFNVS